MSVISKVIDFDIFNQEQEALFALFESLDITQTTFEHPPVFTVAEGDAMGLHDVIPGQGGKSLLLTNDLKELWLVVACDQTRVDMKRLSQVLETKRFSFAKPDIMQDVMRVVPGSATPFALMHDVQRQIRVVIDDTFLQSEYCVFHPLENRFSTVVAFADLVRFLEYLGYAPRIMPVA